MINKIKLLDGSMSFPMEQLGYNLKNKLWTGMALISDPDIIKNIHKGYIEAGATSTYQVSYDRLKNMGYQSSEIKKVFQKSVDLVKEAIKESGSIKILKLLEALALLHHMILKHLNMLENIIQLMMK